VVRGPAYIGRRTLVGVNAFVREFMDAEDGVIIGSHSEVKRSIIQPGAYLGSYTYVTDSVIGEKASLSPYVVTLNMLPGDRVPPRLKEAAYRLSGIAKLGAVIGREARIGARAVLRPGSTVDAGAHIPLGAIVGEEYY
jgi:glucose-1-phosphate thymidylyltransferase